MSEKAAALKAEGNAFLKTKSYPEAVQKYTEAIALERNHVFFSNRCAALMYMGETEKALADAGECIKISPKWTKGYLRKGQALHKLKRYRDAMEAYTEGLKVNSADQSLMRAAQGLRPILMQQQQQQQQSMFTKLFSPQNIAMLKQHPQTAPLFADGTMDKKLELVAKNPQMMSMFQQDKDFMQIVNVLVMQMNPEMAQRAQRAAQEEERQKEAQKDAAASAVNKGYGSWAPPKKKEEPKEEEELTADQIAEKQEKEEAEAAKKKIQEEAAALKAQGNEHYKKKEFDQAINFYKQAIEKDPKNISFITNIAAVNMAQKNYDEVIATCERAIEVGKTHGADYSMMATAYARLGTAYMKKKNYARAIQEFDNAQLEDKTKAVAKKLLKAKKLKQKADELAYQDPEKALAAKNEGNTFFKAGNFPKAIERYTEAIKRNPKNAAFYQNRATAYCKLMEFGVALQDCDKALAIDPKYVKAYARKATIQHFLKKYHKAMETARKGLEIDPNDRMCQDQLQKTVEVIQRNMTSEGPADAETQRRAMEDPEIRSILNDPVVRTVLDEMSTDPTASQRHMSNPVMAAKIQKLIAAGLLRTGKA